MWSKVVLTILFLINSVRSEIFSVSDEDNAHLPRLFHLDDYDRCLSQENGVYCVGEFDLTPLKHTKEYYLIKKYSSNPNVFNHSILHRGYCVSSRCPPELNSTLRFEQCVNKFAQLGSLSSKLRTASCTSRSERLERAKRAPDAAQQLFLRTIHVILLLNFIGTLYDLTEDGNKKNNLLAVWSIRSSWRRLTAVYENGDQRLKDLECIQGMRTIALMLTMYAHTYQFHYQFYVSNPNYLEKFLTRIDGIILANGTSLIQMFVMLSSFLTAYNLLLYSQKHKLSLSLLPLLVVKRIIRISPIHLLLVGYSATWWPYAREGPLIFSTIGQNSEICRRKFWSHVFFVNNIVEPNEKCLPPTWFLPVDMHLYILSSVLTIFMSKKRDKAIRLYAKLIVISAIMCGVTVYIFKWKSMLNILKPEILRGVFAKEDSFGYFYTSSWGSLPACFIGLFMAHLHFELQERKYDVSKLQWFKLAFNLSVPAGLLWVIYTGSFMKQHDNRLLNALYVTVDRPVFCLFMFLIMFGAINIDGVQRRIYSWSGWRVFARISLPIMLSHWIINAIISARPTAYEASFLSAFTDYLATGVITFIVSLLLALFVEIPIQKFVSLILL